MIRAVIFDVDGVLLDTVELHFKSWIKLFKEEGVLLSRALYNQKLNGLPREQGIRNIIPSVSEEKVSMLSDRKQRYLQESIETESISILPHVKESLENLEKKFKLAAASSSKNSLKFLQRTGLVSFFECIVTGNDFEKPKPDPELFLKAASRLEVNPQECVVVEDAAVGVQAAHKGRMKAIGITYKRDRELEKAADIIIKNFSQIEQAIKKLSN